MSKDGIAESFKDRYGRTPTLLVRSPGRINLIGEHTDYNEGFVLPAAIDREIRFALAPNDSQRARFYAQDLDEAAEVDLHAIE
ncbi:MAG: galactokinase family protein, partial [Catalinimonas sp.]